MESILSHLKDGVMQLSRKVSGLARAGQCGVFTKSAAGADRNLPTFGRVLDSRIYLILSMKVN